jgi:transcriptional regulator with XRE-family HTH domain
MSMEDWEARVLEVDGAPERVSGIEDELRLAAGLTALRERVGLSQAEVAARIGVSQPRVAAIERSSNVTIDLLERYVGALVPGGSLEIMVVLGRQRFPLLNGATPAKPTRTAARAASAPSTAAAHRSLPTRKTAAKGIGAARKKAS